MQWTFFAFNILLIGFKYNIWLVCIIQLLFILIAWRFKVFANLLLRVYGILTLIVHLSRILLGLFLLLGLWIWISLSSFRYFFPLHPSSYLSALFLCDIFFMPWEIFHYIFLTLFNELLIFLWTVIVILNPRLNGVIKIYIIHGFIFPQFLHKILSLHVPKCPISIILFNLFKIWVFPIFHSNLLLIFHFFDNSVK